MDPFAVASVVALAVAIAVDILVYVPAAIVAIILPEEESSEEEESSSDDDSRGCFFFDFFVDFFFFMDKSLSLFLLLPLFFFANKSSSLFSPLPIKADCNTIMSNPATVTIVNQSNTNFDCVMVSVHIPLLSASFNTCNIVSHRNVVNTLLINNANNRSKDTNSLANSMTFSTLSSFDIVLHSSTMVFTSVDIVLLNESSISSASGKYSVLYLSKDATGL